MSMVYSGSLGQPVVSIARHRGIFDLAHHSLLRLEYYANLIVIALVHSGVQVVVRWSSFAGAIGRSSGPTARLHWT